MYYMFFFKFIYIKQRSIFMLCMIKLNILTYQFKKYLIKNVCKLTFILKLLKKKIKKKKLFILLLILYYKCLK